MKEERLRIAIQKSGRLSEKSIALFQQCGIKFDLRKDQLLHMSKDFPLDLMLVRDDDIPTYTLDGVCDLGIVGENVLREKLWSRQAPLRFKIEKIMSLGFGDCRLSLAVDQNFSYRSPQSLEGLVIATSHPACLKEFLVREEVNATVIELCGSVEIAPTLNIADAICDLVSSGATLRSNGLREVTKIFDSQACLVRTGQKLSEDKKLLIDRLQQRMRGVMAATKSKYVMLNAPKSSLTAIFDLLPRLGDHSIRPMGPGSENISLSAVSYEDIYWDTIEQLKLQGASSILVLPIEKVVS